MNKSYVAAAVLSMVLASTGASQYGFDIECTNDTFHEPLPGSTAVFQFTLLNTGALADTFGLQVPLESDSFPSDEWVSLVYVRGAFIPSGETTYVDLPAGSADSSIQVHVFTYSVYPSWGTGKTTLFVTSEGNTALRDSVNLWVTVAKFMRGDVSNELEVTMADGLRILRHLYVPGSPSPTCDDAADVNDDGTHTLGDAIYLFRYLYVPGSPQPPPPFPDCGQDPTWDGLRCDWYP